MTKKVMIVTGEASGDLHGAGVIRALRRRINNLQVSGMGGAELASCGVEILCDAEKVSVVGVFEVFARLGDILGGAAHAAPAPESRPARPVAAH